jgi:hypothetical protein
MTLSNKPTVGADNDTWGQELNDALDELDTNKAEVTSVYTKTAADARYVRTINSVAPDGSGNVNITDQIGSLDQTARDAAAAAQADIDDANANAGHPGGFALLDSSSQLAAGSALNFTAIVQNTNGTWPLRPATANSLDWKMIVPSSAPPAGNGTVAGGAGMVPLLDTLVDNTGTLGA